MKKANLLIVFMCLVGLILLVAPHLSGQALPSAAKPEVVLDVLAKKANEIHSWESKALVLTFLSVVVGVLGVLTGVFQKYDKKWAKVATVIAGVTISIITVVNNVVFPIDHRTLRQNAVHGAKLVDEIKVWISNLQPDMPEPEKNVVWTEVFKRMDQLNQLEEKLISANASIDFGATVYAQGQQPAWVQSPPYDKINLYFVGIAESASLTQAKKDSFNSAVSQAAKQFADQVNKDQAGQAGEIKPDLLQGYVEKFAQVAESSLAYGNDGKVYRYFTLLKIDRSYAQTKFIVAFAPRPATPPPFVQPLGNARGHVSLPWNLNGSARVEVRADRESKGFFSFNLTLVRRDSVKTYIKLTEIEVFQDGGFRSASWRFDVLVNGKLAFNVPRKKYDHERRPPLYRMTPADRAEATVDVPEGTSFDLAIVGYTR